MPKPGPHRREDPVRRTRSGGDREGWAPFGGGRQRLTGIWSSQNRWAEGTIGLL